jgi:sec-independent protein translocase protein TatA
MLGNLGFSELMLILVVCLLVFGAKRLPEIGSSIGKGIREFKKSISEAGDSINAPVDDRSPTSRQIETPTKTTTGEPKRLSQ